MSGHSAKNDAACPVPECDVGYVRIPVVIERVLYGHTEKFVEFTDYQCAECGGMGRVRAHVIPPAKGAS